MPKRVQLTDEQIEWLKTHCYDLSYAEMARGIGCCSDTLKRILVRLDLKHFNGAKYAVEGGPKQHTWTRPCTNCGCTKARPKWQFRCVNCHEKEESWEDTGFEDLSGWTR
jgi:hypothetical protein